MLQVVIGEDFAIPLDFKLTVRFGSLTNMQVNLSMFIDSVLAFMLEELHLEEAEILWKEWTRGPENVSW
jgi:hypothetical protein